MDEQQHDDDQLLASAIQFLIDGGDEKAAMIMLSCTLRYDEEEYGGGSPYHHITRTITLAAPRLSYDFLDVISTDWYYDADANVPTEVAEKVGVCASIRRALQALTNAHVQIVVKAGLVPITAQWRHELLALLRGERVTNQGLSFAPQRPILTWNGLRFRSASEVRIAEALERAQVLFLPNCLARLGFKQRENREADFLICQRGKWSILEVDGPFAHLPARKVDDDERARLFKAHGIRLVEHFDAGDCLEDADGVVKRFLYLLGQ
jgi:hypothetical protein